MLRSCDTVPVPIEAWSPIPRHLHYEVSSMGRVRSYRVRGSKNKISGSPRLLTQHGDGRGRLCVKIDGKTFKVHRLVMEVFVGPRPDGMDIDHLNENPRDNRLCNLRYEQPSLNRGSLRFRRRQAA